MINKPIKILHVIVGLDVGGAESFLCRLIEAHQSNPDFQHRVISLTTKGILGPSLESKGVQVKALGMRTPLDIVRVYFKLVSEIRSDIPDVVQCWMYYSDLLGGLAARRIGIKNILWGIRNSHFEAGGTRLKKTVRKICAFFSYYLPNKIICVANSALSVHVNAGYDYARMIVIHNGYDLNKFQMLMNKRKLIRTELGFNENNIVIGSVGRYSPAKDHASFIKAAGFLLKENENVRFMLVGRDVTYDNQTLSKIINDTGFSERFALLGEQSDIPAYLSAIDIFCLHSKTEGFPNALAEAMCVGLPCVTTNVGDAAILVGDTGLIVEDDLHSLLNALRQIIGMPTSERAVMAFKSKQRIRDNFSIEKAVIAYESLYKIHE